MNQKDKTQGERHEADETKNKADHGVAVLRAEQYAPPIYWLPCSPVAFNF
jgi:hypothetical protein